MPAGACQTVYQPPTGVIAPPHGLPAFACPPLAPQAGARLQPVDVTVLSAHRNRRNAVIQGQIAWIYSAGQGTERGKATMRKSYDRDKLSRDARARPAPPPGALERPQEGPTGAGINTVSLCVSQARPVWWRDAGRAGRLERGSEPHATGAQKVAATRRTTSAAWARATPS